MTTERLVVVLCDEPNATIDVYSRTDGTRTASLAATKTRVRIDLLLGEPRTARAAGAVVLVDHNVDTDRPVWPG